MKNALLIVDDNERVYQSLAINFQRNGFVCHWAADNRTALDLAERHEPAAAVIDPSLGSESGLDVMGNLVSRIPSLPVVFISGFGTLEAAVAAMKMGAFDFLPKPLDFKRLLEVVRSAIAAGRGASPALTHPPRADAGSPVMPTIVSVSPSMEKLIAQAGRAADSDITVLITGESGTGKELLAEYIHAASRRAGQPLVRVNCSAIADSLAESELFGHVKGSFTGAVEDHAGYFAQADGGTLHLDEIGDMPFPIQAKILRTLENSLIRPVGGKQEIPVDVRFVASTNKNLGELVERGAFRNDLYFRINPLQLHIPPLRERREDIAPLLRHFLSRQPGREAGKRFSVEAEKALLAYDWPGNVRELQNLVKVCALLSPGAIIEADDLPQAVRSPSSSGAHPPASTSQSGRLEDAERHAIRTVLDEVGGNRRMAAERLGISVRTLYYKLDRYGLS
ncbi:MAG: sigma-54 dependent transcriptional regulator [Planctomycetaceae bacterium]|nr:sigma-54 dependent transcriptional regulator [Planctomycetaceae bacterium]